MSTKRVVTLTDPQIAALTRESEARQIGVNELIRRIIDKWRLTADEPRLRDQVGNTRHKDRHVL